METGDVRTYRILALVGQGGFGKVYRARMETRTGFVREVAVKLLNAENPPSDVLERFRDEARILGLVRDRAIVAVEPPVRLRQRWAVIMEYIEGASLSLVLREHRHLPADVALEIVGEVARVLDKVWNQLGPDGRPLHLIHRDLKPGNLQLTPHGEVKVLDFGIARAEFDGREAQSQGLILGTPGFIAPERFEGREGPEADVFSLGVILEALSTGWSPSRAPRTADESIPAGAVREAVDLAREMTRQDPTRRPTAREVERRCAELAAKHRTVGLRGWSEVHVPPLAARSIASDPMSGTVLSEGVPSTGPALGSRLGLVAFLSGGVAGVSGLVVGLVSVTALVVVAVVLAADRATPPAPAAVPAPMERPAPPLPAVSSPVPEPVPEPAPEPVPVPAPAASAPVTPARPVETVRPPAPAPAPVAPGPALPDPDAPVERPYNFGIDAPYKGTCEVSVDGARLTAVPTLKRSAVADGVHAVEFRCTDGQAGRAEVVFAYRKGTIVRWYGGDDIRLVP